MAIPLPAHVALGMKEQLVKLTPTNVLLPLVRMEPLATTWSTPFLVNVQLDTLEPLAVKLLTRNVERSARATMLTPL